MYVQILEWNSAKIMFLVFQGSCKVVHCKTMKGVIDHMRSCSDGAQCQCWSFFCGLYYICHDLCTVPHCASSRKIWTHFENCTVPDCQTCGPIKSHSLQKPREDAAPLAAPTGMDISAEYAGATLRLYTNLNVFPSVPQSRPSRLPAANGARSSMRAIATK